MPTSSNKTVLVVLCWVVRFIKSSSMSDWRCEIMHAFLFTLERGIKDIHITSGASSPALRRFEEAAGLFQCGEEPHDCLKVGIAVFLYWIYRGGGGQVR